MRRAALLLVIVTLGCGKEPDPPQDPKPRDNTDMIRRARAQVEALDIAVKTFYVEHARFPTSLQELVAPPEGKPFVKAEALIDPWGQQYKMTAGPGANMAQLNEDVPVVWSIGPPDTPW